MRCSPKKLDQRERENLCEPDRPKAVGDVKMSMFSEEADGNGLMQFLDAHAPVQ
jgi:hypothetical protein